MIQLDKTIIVQLDKTIIEIFADVNFVVCFLALKEFKLGEIFFFVISTRRAKCKPRTSFLSIGLSSILNNLWIMNVLNL